MTLLGTVTPAFGQASFTGLGDLPGGSFGSGARAISADGSVAVGIGSSASGLEAFRWTAAGGMVGLGDLPGSLFRSVARGVSADGSIVVGVSQASAGGAFIWTAGGGMVNLGDLPGGDPFSEAGATSADGSVVVGCGNSASGFEAFRWTQVGGMVGLGDLPGGGFQSDALAVSADGSVIVGESSSTASGISNREAFRWTAGTGMVGLGDLPGGAFDGEALAVSANGSVVVGVSSAAGFGFSGEAFIWDAANGMRSLPAILVNDFGLDLTGWTLKRATGISADGLTIVGGGDHNPFGPEAWIATLVPTPSCTLQGDLNQDGFVRGDDIDGYVRAVLGLPPEPGEEPTCADFGTGKLDGDTATFIAALLSGP